jgi:hypothetical protein
MIIQQADSPLQRSFLSSTNSLQQPQIITVNHQPIKTETIHTHPSPLTISSFQQKTIIKQEDDLSDDLSGMNNNRHIMHDDRLIPAMNLRRRLHELGKRNYSPIRINICFSLAEKDKRIAGVLMNDDAAFGLISNAAKERLKYLIEQVKLVAQHRIDISMKVELKFIRIDLLKKILFRMIRLINKPVMSKVK